MFENPSMSAGRAETAGAAHKQGCMSFEERSFFIGARALNTDDGGLALGQLAVAEAK